MIVAGVKLQAASVLAATAHASALACVVPKLLDCEAQLLPLCRRVTLALAEGSVSRSAAAKE